MGKNIVNEIPQAAIVASTQKKAYKKPVFHVYGAVHHLTQGSSGTLNDNMTMQQTAMSDRACKINLVRVGNHPLNISLYLFDYKEEFKASAGYGRQFGVMADEVETVMPEAVVVHADGFKRVNYAMLGIDLSPPRAH